MAIAASWQNVPPQKNCQVQGEKLVSLGDSVRALGLDEGSVVAVSFEVEPNCKVGFVEHVEVVVSVEHPRRGEVEVVLISPSNTRTRLLGPRPKDTSDNGFLAWPLMSVETWGEKPHGSWRLYIADRWGHSFGYHGIFPVCIICHLILMAICRGVGGRVWSVGDCNIVVHGHP